MAAWAVDELRAFLAARPRHPKETPDSLFLGVNSDTTFEALKRLRDARGWGAGLTLQGLRRSVVARGWAAGLPPQQLAAIMGHSVATAERHYADAGLLAARAAVEKLTPARTGPTQKPTQKKRAIS